MKEHLKFAVKVVFALLIINAALDIIAYFGGAFGSTVNKFVYHPVGSFVPGANPTT